MAVRDNIDRTADHDGRASLGTDLPGKIRMPAQIAFRTQGVKVRVHPLGCADPFRQIRDFRNIALNDVKTDFPEQHRCCFIAKTGSPHAHGIEYHGAAQPVGLLPRRQHGLYRPLAERAYVQHQRGAMPDDLLHFTQIIGHDGRTAQSQRHVGTIIDRDIIGNKMHQRPFLPHGAQYIFKGVHPSAFLSSSAGYLFKHAAQPYRAVFTRPRQPAPGHRPVQRKTADPSEPFQRLFSMPENLAFRREASHDLAIMSMPFTPPYATEKAWALPVRHPCCPYHSGHTPWAFHCREPITFRRDASPRFTGRPPFSSPYFPLYKGIFPQAPFFPKQD